MRIHRLEITGFGPFLRPQTVDFDAFADEGIFVISGRTGAGKSSILDAICFALYGSVPRYDGGEKRLRSDHCGPDDATLVALEFTAAGERWRVERSPEYERAKSRGEGTTTAPPQARLFLGTTEGWEGRAARPRDVGEALHEVLPLTQEQFLQVILLAQNRFARFLLSSHGERQALLRTLFGTRRFEEYEHALEERRKGSQARIERGRDALDHRLDEAERLIAEHGLDADGEAAVDAVARIERVRQAAQRGAYRAETAGHAQEAALRARDAAEAALADVLARRELQERRDRARERVETLQADVSRIDAARAERNAAVRAEGVRDALEVLEAAGAGASGALDARRAAEAAWISVAAEAEDVGASPTQHPLDAASLDAVSLERVAGEVARLVGGWRPLLVREAGIAESRAELAARRDELAELRTVEAASRAERDGVTARCDEIDARLWALAPTLAGRESAEERLVDLDARLTAAREAERLDGDAAAAESRALHADRALAEASAVLVDLRERRLRGHAGELAAALVPGEPCAVCGGVQHPAPAPRGDDSVGADEIEAAEQHLAVAVTAQRAASDESSRVRQEAAGARGRAGERSPDELIADRAATAEVLAAAVAAHDESVALRAEREGCVRAIDTATQVLAETTPRAEAIERTLAVLEASIEVDEAALAEARGDFGTIAERIAAVERIGAAAEGLRDALSAEGRAAHAEAEARLRVAAKLAEAGFPDVPAAAAALRDRPTRERLDEQIRQHETALAAARAVLLDLELQTLPEEPIDTAQAVAAHEQARETWTAAVQQTLAAEQTRDRLSTLAADAAAAQAGIAEALTGHESIERLAHTVAGKAPNTHRMKLETFVLAAELEEIVQAANLRLDEMSDGRYRLLHTDALAARGAASGLGIEVLDAYTGRPRPTQSLSGGETFLASLALALGLAEVVTSRAGGISLDTLFIDEGFGSLDAETLDTAMRTLDELRQGGRTVGVISHVEAMKDQIPAQLLVTVATDGSSEVLARTTAVVENAVV